MKKLLLAALLCCGVGMAQAQYTAISINNMTSCTVYVQLNGNVSGGACAPNYRSNVIGIPSGTTTTFSDPSVVPGGVNPSPPGPALGASDYFNTVTVLDAAVGATCTPTAYYLSDCWGSPPVTFVPSVTFRDAVCNSCGTLDISWNVLVPGMHAQVDIQ